MKINFLKNKFEQKMNKKAASLVVTTVLLIFIVLIIGGLILVFAVNFLDEKQSETKGFSFYYKAELYVLTELATGPIPPEIDELELGVKRIDNVGENK